jgi:hypothetical protein
MMTNTSREVIFPAGFTETELLEGLDYDSVIRREQKDLNKVPRIRVNIHMMQGIYANTGGLINTISVTGLAESMRIITEDRIITQCATTSDDVVRVVDFGRNFRIDDVEKTAVDIPNTYLGISMMKENVTKPIVSTNIAEFNNVVITRDGMVPQGPIHSVLIHQPLFGKTPMTDIIAAVSNARSTLFWGDSPDLAESALFGNIEMLKQKWLITSEEWDQLLIHQLIPSDMSELISGFFPRSKQSLGAMWWALESDVRDQVLKGTMSITNACHIFAEEPDAEPKKVKLINYLPKTLHRTSRLVKSIGIMRKVGSRLNPRYVQPIHFTKRRKAMERTLELLLTETRDVDEDTYNRIKPPRIKVHMERHRKRDQRPTKIGMSAMVQIPSLSRLRAQRFCKVSVGIPLTEEEIKISELDDLEFEFKEGEIERQNSYQGISFKSPGGLPLTRMFDGRFFRVPMSFNFSVHLEHGIQKADQPFMYRGTLVKEFKTCKWGDDSLEEVGDVPLAFGSGYINGTFAVFFKEPNRNVIAIEVEKKEYPSVIYTRQRKKVGMFIGSDASPIGAQHFKRSTLPLNDLPGVSGDMTAIINHGSYLLSSQKGGFSLYRQLYKSRDSEMPIYCQKYMLDYPTYQEPITKIKPGNTTILKGSFCSLNLEFDGMPSSTATVMIDLEGDTPVVVENVRRRRQWRR